MVTLLAKIFIKDSEDKIKQREAYGMLCGVIGILFNVLLFIGKFLAGTLSNSIAITADAFNRCRFFDRDTAWLQACRGKTGYGASIWTWKD